MKRLFAAAAACVAALCLFLAGATPASAASYAQGVYKPEMSGDQLVGKANMHTDCGDTLGCYTYVKLQYKADLAGWAQAIPAVNAANDWQDAGGHWANDGWNTVVYDPSHLHNPYGGTGCGELRMTALSYNDVIAGPPVNVGVSVNTGPVTSEVSLGDGIRRFETRNSSESIHVCPFMA